MTSSTPSGERLWGVGLATASKLHRRGIATVGQVAGLPEPAVVSMLGRAAGRYLHALAHNRGPDGSTSACAVARSDRSARWAAEGLSRSRYEATRETHTILATATELLGPRHRRSRRRASPCSA